MLDRESTEMPTSLDDYVQGVVKALPKGLATKGLKKIQLFNPVGAEPEKAETIFNWLRIAERSPDGNLPLTLVLGETDGEFRVRRSDAPDSGKLTMARTCDGAFGAETVFGLLRA